MLIRPVSLSLKNISKVMDQMRHSQFHRSILSPHGMSKRFLNVSPVTTMAIQRPSQNYVSLSVNLSKFRTCVNNNQTLMFRVLSTSSDLNDPGNQERKRIMDKQSINKFDFAEQSFFGLLSSLVKFGLNVIAAILKVLFHFVKMLSGTGGKGEKYVNRASKQTEEFKEPMYKTNDGVKKGYEKTKAMMDQKIPQVKSKIDHQIPEMTKSLDNFSKRMDTEFTETETTKEKMFKFFQALIDLIQSNIVYQIVTLILVFSMMYKVYKFFF